jgi:hypothetical protein
MDTKDVMNYVREELREQPDLRFSEIYFRTVIYFRTIGHRVSSADVGDALVEMSDRNEIRIKDGKWSLVSSVERRKSA